MANENRTYFAKAASTTDSFGYKDIFSGVFLKHSREDMNRTFSVGMSGNMPAGSSLLDGWQKPWLFARFLAYGVLAWLLLVLVALGLSVDSITIGAVYIIPAAVVPLSIAMFFWEMNIPRNIPIYDFLKFIIFGGIACSTVCTVLDVILNTADASSELEEYAFVGIIEELTKLVIVAFLLRKPERCWGLNGLAIGAAVGCGFAVFETNGYAIQALINGNSVTNTLFVRGLCAIAGHVPWATMYGGALALVKGRQKLNVRHFFNSTFLITFISAVLLHFAWDYMLTDSFKDFFVIGDWTESLYNLLLNDYVFVLIFAVIDYAIILWVMRKCVRQVVLYSAGAQHSYAAVPDPAAVSVRASVSAPASAPAPARPAVLQLECVSGELSGTIYTIDPGRTLTIGRGDQNVIQYADTAKGVSRSHCSVSFDGVNALVTDLASSHGTFLANGQRFQPNRANALGDGETFYLASPKNTFRVCIH